LRTGLGKDLEPLAARLPYPRRTFGDETWKIMIG